MQASQHIKPLTEAQRAGIDHPEQVSVWLAINRGRTSYTAIADELGLSDAYIREVALKQKPSKDNRVERTLARYGCPGFEHFMNEE